jgi:hypothetical protein
MGSTIAFIQQRCQAETLAPQPRDDEEERETESDSSKLNTRQFVRLSDDMIDMLIQRKHDVSSYARSAVLRVWVSLVRSSVNYFKN